MVSGRLAANAEIKVTKTGTQYIEFRMANNERTFGNGSSDNGNKDTCWFRVFSFNHTHLQPYLLKGKPIEVFGDLYTNPYISNVTNKAEAGLEIRANDIMFDNNFGNSNQQQGEVAQVANTTNNLAQTAATSTKPRNPSTTTVPTQPAPTPTPTADNDDSDDLPF